MICSDLEEQHRKLFQGDKTTGPSPNHMLIAVSTTMTTMKRMT
jgi:hypothetical protein